MTGNGRVAGVGQAKGDQTSASALGLRIGRYLRKKSIHDQLADVFALQASASATPNQTGSVAQQCDLDLFRRPACEQ
jgi:hypothetical protein